MSLIHSFASPQMGTLSHGSRHRAEGQALALALALLIAVLVVEAVAIANAVPGLSGIGWFYASTT